jgi:hypothetical protein
MRGDLVSLNGGARHHLLIMHLTQKIDLILLAIYHIKCSAVPKMKFTKPDSHHKATVSACTARVKRTLMVTYAPPRETPAAAAVSPVGEAPPAEYINEKVASQCGDDFYEACRPFHGATVDVNPRDELDIANVPYVPDRAYGKYMGIACLKIIVYSARILANDRANDRAGEDVVVMSAAKVAAFPKAHDMFFVPVPVYTLEPTGEVTVYNTTLFNELVLYASRAGLSVTADDRVVQSTGTASLLEYMERTPVTANRMRAVLTSLYLLSMDPLVATMIPDPVQWLFSVFL